MFLWFVIEPLTATCLRIYIKVKETNLATLPRTLAELWSLSCLSLWGWSFETTMFPFAFWLVWTLDFRAHQTTQIISIPLKNQSLLCVYFYQTVPVLCSWTLSCICASWKKTIGFQNLPAGQAGGVWWFDWSSLKPAQLHLLLVTMHSSCCCSDCAAILHNLICFSGHQNSRSYLSAPTSPTTHMSSLSMFPQYSVNVWGCRPGCKRGQ